MSIQIKGEKIERRNKVEVVAMANRQTEQQTQRQSNIEAFYFTDRQAGRQNGSPPFLNSVSDVNCKRPIWMIFWNFDDMFACSRCLINCLGTEKCIIFNGC